MAGWYYPNTCIASSQKQKVPESNCFLKREGNYEKEIDSGTYYFVPITSRYLLLLELCAGQAVLFDDFPGRIGNSQLEYALCQIDSNSSSIHFGLLSLIDADTHTTYESQLAR